MLTIGYQLDWERVKQEVAFLKEQLENNAKKRSYSPHYMENNIYRDFCVKLINDGLTNWRTNMAAVYRNLHSIEWQVVANDFPRIVVTVQVTLTRNVDFFKQSITLNIPAE